MGPGEPTVDCVCLPLFGLTDGAMGAKEWKPGFAYTVRACYGPVLTSSDKYSGVVVMVSRPSAVPNEPWRANCELRVFYLSPSAVPNEPWRANCGLRVFYLSLASPTGHWGIGGQGVKAWRCIHGARALWTSVDL